MPTIEKTPVAENISSSNIPWEPRPEGDSSLVWRYSSNPVITRQAVHGVASIYNSAVIKFGNRFAGIFRVDDGEYVPRLHAGSSNNGIDWKISDQPIQLRTPFPEDQRFEYGYDPRITKIEDSYYITWCNGYRELPTIGVARTLDFEYFEQLENAFLPYNRNGVLFPRKINGRYAMLSRPSDQGHTPFGDIFYSESPDMEFWGRHRYVMGPARGWQSLKTGAANTPIETPEGWLIFYHGVMQKCSGMIYSMGAALLDLERPWIVRHRTVEPLMTPRENYERIGDVGNVIFPVSCLHDAATGRIAIYYGAADTVTALAFTELEPLMAHLKKQPAVPARSF